MKRTTRPHKLIYPARRTSPDPTIDVVTDYVPEPSPSECACHPGVAAAWERNLYAPGWHCKICHKLPIDFPRKGETE